VRHACPRGALGNYTTLDTHTIFHHEWRYFP